MTHKGHPEGNQLSITPSTTFSECKEMGGVNWKPARNEDGKAVVNDKGQSLGNCIHKDS